MKIFTLALTAIALSSAAALAAGAPPEGRPLRLAEMVAQMESRFPGEVTAIQYDDSGDKAAHYHVDMRFADFGLARWDVDAATLEITSRDPVAPAAGSATLAYAAALIAANVPGQVIVAEFDSSESVSPHYDVDVRLPQGEIARLKVDPMTRQIAWRTPAIAAE